MYFILVITFCKRLICQQPTKPVAASFILDLCCPALPSDGGLVLIIFSHDLLKLLFVVLGVRERAREQCVRETCEAALLLTLHPRSSLSLILQVIHDDGSVSWPPAKKIKSFRQYSFPRLNSPVFILYFSHSLIECCHSSVSCLSSVLCVLIKHLAVIVLSECCLYGSHRCRATHELSFLWRDLCHYQRGPDNHRSNGSTGEGTFHFLLPNHRVCDTGLYFECFVSSGKSSIVNVCD